MDKIIERQEERLLSEDDLFKIADIPKYPHFVRHSELDDVKDLNKFMNMRHGVVVILWESEKNMGHWTCLLRHADLAMRGGPLYEFFDSYGLAPDEELKFGEYGRAREKIGKPVLRPLLENCGFKWTYNSKKLQAKYEHVNTCGRYVGLRMLFREKTQDEFIDLLTKNKHYNPDFWVSALTLCI